MADDTTQSGPKTGHRPPHKNMLTAPRNQAPAAPQPVDDSARPHVHGRFIGTSPHQIPIMVTQDTVDAEAFLAPRDIDLAIAGLPQKQQKQVRDALDRCLANPEVCQNGADNESYLHSTAKGAQHEFEVKQGHGFIRDAQAIVDAEKWREGKILSDSATKDKVGPAKPKSPTPH